MHEITVQDLKKNLETGENIQVIDIREEVDFESWHIAGSKNLPIYDATKAGDVETIKHRIQGLPRDSRIVTVCAAGNTSLTAAAIFRSLGYDATSLKGGIREWSLAWSEAPIPLPSTPEATFLQVRRNGKGCLSYLVGSKGEAVVVDPSLEPEVYVGLARQNDLHITHVLETHIHADHVSRGRALVELTEAALVLPEKSHLRVNYPYQPLADGETLNIADIRIEAIATPGHTTESTCYLINNEAVLTGDTLFAESIGRPDLEKGDEGAEDGARLLYASLHQRLLRLPQQVMVCPGHYGGDIGFDRVPIAATIAELKRKLSILTLPEEEFVSQVVASLPSKPPNFTAVININEGKFDWKLAHLLDLEAGPNRCAISTG